MFHVIDYLCSMKKQKHKKQNNIYKLDFLTL